MADQAFIDYPGISNIRGMNFTYSRGVTPSVCTLYVVPQDNFDPGVGTLTFGYGSQQMQFKNMAVAACNQRPHWDGLWPVWAVQLKDRRWKWGGSISGKYNDHLQGTTGLVSARDLMFLCLLAMGETTANVSGGPTGVFPYVNWNATNPALALADLCERCACEVVLNPLSDGVEIWQCGVGRSSPTNLTETTPKWRFVPRANVPSSIVAQGGPSFFQYRLRLEGVARGTNLFQTVTPDWIQTGGVSPLIESFNWPSVTSTVGSELALATGWRQFRVKSQEGGGLNVPGLNIAITSTSQYDLQDFILYTTFDDRTGKYQLLPYYLEGDFWPYADLPVNTSNTVYLGASTLYKERNLVEVPYPLVKLDSAGYIGEPTLYLQAAYKVKDTQGNYVSFVRTGTVGGSGGPLVLKRPECFAAYSPTGNTESVIGAELDAYIQLFTQKYSNPMASALTYGGTIVGTLDGVINQCNWTIHPSRGVTTTVYENFEGDIYTPSAEERRRRERLRMLWEAGNDPNVT